MTDHTALLEPSVNHARLPWRAQLLHKLLERLSVGALAVTFPDGTERFYGTGEPLAMLIIKRWDVFDQVFADGDIGFAEAYLRGDWSSPDLAALLTVFCANRDAMQRAIYGGFWGTLLNRIKHLINTNTRRGSRRNIAAHYDLGNDFYRLWLDPSMTYSSALFAADRSQSLVQAQHAKYDRVLDRLGVTAGHSIVEVGCGWGGFAELAAGRGARLTGLSLSREQVEYARARMARAGLSTHAQFEYRDYRDEPGRFDHLVSIEMYEAVGERYWPAYFRSIKRLLKPGGRAIVQAITIDERLFARYRRGSDFIQQYVFPGGMLASPARFEREAQQAGLEVIDRFAFGSDYAETLRRWRHNFMARLDDVRNLGFDERFTRMWEFYLAYCEAGFASGSTDVYQYELRA